MLAPVSDAIQRFRARLRLAAFVRGLLLGFFVLAATVAALLLAERFLTTGALTNVPGWSLWAVVGAGALLIGIVIARRQKIDDAVVVAHLEQRLSTSALLLAASQGVELDSVFVQRLGKQLGHIESVLPAIRWSALSLRPVVAALLLAVMQWLPPGASAKPAVEALAVAAQRLGDELMVLAERQAVPDERVAELRRAVADLNERAEAGEQGLWRDMDQLRERIERERQLADTAVGGAAQATSSDSKNRPGEDASQGSSGDSSVDSAGDSSNGDDSPSSVAGAPSVEALAEAMATLGALDREALQKLTGELPPDLGAAAKQAIAAAIQSDGSVDAAALPEDDAARQALADAVRDAASKLADDPTALAELGAGLTEKDQQQMAEQLAELAAQFEASADRGSEAGAQPSSPELSAELAKAAIEMANAGALEELPKGLQEAIAKAGMSVLESMDVETLLSMLPDDLSELMSMAESVAKLAEGMQAERPMGGDPQRGGGEQPTKAMQAKMASLARGLMEKMGKGPGSVPSSSAPQSGARGARGQGGQPGEPGAMGRAAVGTDGGGHAALRMTEDTQGGTSAKEMELPQPELGDLPTEWVPLTVEKAQPEVGETQTNGVGRAGASGSGGATWQLRLMPRHREVVRRFFAGKKK